MMANNDFWPNCKYDFYSITSVAITSAMLPINKPRTKAILRIGPHNKEVLDVIICGLLGDFWGDTIAGKLLNSTRFQIEQSISNTAYIHYLTLYFYKLGYCARPIPVLVEKLPTTHVEKGARGSGKLCSSCPACRCQALTCTAAALVAADQAKHSRASAASKVALTCQNEELINANIIEKRFNYRLTLFSFTSFN